MIAILRAAEPDGLRAASEGAVLAAFGRAIAEVPAYREIFSAAGNVPASRIVDIESFRRFAPLLDKHNTFGAHEVRDLCLAGSLEGVRSFLTSSGHSGVFSFGVNTSENLARSAQSIDMGLEYVFGVDRRSTLLINALPMGVKVHTRATVLAETSVRDDMVFALVKKFARDFEQILIVAEGSFAKKILEDGAENHGIDWPSMRIGLITGEEGIAENYRDYVGGLIGGDPDDPANDRLVMSSMGVAELDLNIFHETRDTIRIRRLAHRNPALRRALFGDATAVCPMFFIYYPHRCYVEELAGNGTEPELVISMLSPEMKIPLLRYRSGDLGRVLDHGQVVETLARFGHAISPDLKLPFVAVHGRGNVLATGANRLTPEEVKEAIYADRTVAASVTGNFRLLAGEKTIDVLLQLREGKHVGGDDEMRFQALLPSFARPRFFAYDSFPYGMCVDWERKFQYI